MCHQTRRRHSFPQSQSPQQWNNWKLSKQKRESDRKWTRVSAWHSDTVPLPQGSIYQESQYHIIIIACMTRLWHKAVCITVPFEFSESMTTHLLTFLFQEHFSWHLKTAQKEIRRGSPQSPNGSTDFSSGGANVQQTVNVLRQLGGDDCQEAMFPRYKRIGKFGKRCLVLLNI